MEDRIIANFLSLTAIPRKSHHEEAVSRFLYDWALGKGLAACRDEAGNVVIDKPGTPGHENAPVAIMQAHMDMVCVAEEGKEYDPLTDPITVINDGKVLTADGTSLGGDDGAGVAIAMAILEDETAVHGPIRAIFTVDEEDGMSGAEALDPRHLEGQYMINLDWEEFGSLCCSSAGCETFAFSHPAHWEPAAGQAAFSLTLQGLEGGHSGAQIHLGRANAIRLAARVLAAGANAGCQVRLAAFRGGVAPNAIPSSAAAVVTVPAAQEDTFRESVQAALDSVLEEYGVTDPNAVAALLRTDLPEKAMTAADTTDCLALLTAVHDGVYTMSPAIPGLVESSSNIGVAELKETGLEFIIMQRSSAPTVTAQMRDIFLGQADHYNFAAEILGSSPPWPVRSGSELVEICKRHYRAMTGEEIRVEPVHAGLECGCFSTKNPGLDIISIGPDILDIHSPKEALVLRTVTDCDTLVRNILKEIAEK